MTKQRTAVMVIYWVCTVLAATHVIWILVADSQIFAGNMYTLIEQPNFAAEASQPRPATPNQPNVPPTKKNIAHL